MWTSQRCTALCRTEGKIHIALRANTSTGPVTVSSMSNLRNMVAISQNILNIPNKLPQIVFIGDYSTIELLKTCKSFYVSYTKKQEPVL